MSANQNCERCGEPLTTVVWLELNWRTGRYSDPARTTIPPEDSQGAFPFGAACARAVLRANGLLRNAR